MIMMMITMITGVEAAEEVAVAGEVAAVTVEEVPARKHFADLVE